MALEILPNISIFDIFDIDNDAKKATVKIDSPILKDHFGLVPGVFLKELMYHFAQISNFFGHEVVFCGKVKAGGVVCFHREDDGGISLTSNGKAVITSIPIGSIGRIHEYVRTKAAYHTVPEEPCLPHKPGFQLVTNSGFDAPTLRSLMIGDTFWGTWKIPSSVDTALQTEISNSLIEEACAQLVANAFGKKNPEYTLLYEKSATIKESEGKFFPGDTLNISGYISDIKGSKYIATYVCTNQDGKRMFHAEITGQKFPTKKLK